MKELRPLFENNKIWAEKIKENHPDFFLKLSKQQSPEFLWIGCSDSRVPANEIVGLLPGELFVHRNIANIVVHTDLNCLSVIQYAVEVLKVKHIIVCGHYGCGGVTAAMSNNEFGLVDNWLRHIKDIYQKHREKIDKLQSNDEKINLLCELNVKEQVYNVAHSITVQNAWKRGEDLSVHGLIYSIKDGLLKDLHLHISKTEDTEALYRE